MSTHAPASSIAPQDLPPDIRIAVVAARFNDHIVSKLIDGCLARLSELGLAEPRVQLHRVPGAFELPLAAKLLAQTHRYNAVIALGCVIRGETPHFEYVSGECARGLQQVALAESLPVVFGVLTTNTEAQALDRSGGVHGHAGRGAAETAAEMVLLAGRLRQGL